MTLQPFHLRSLVCHLSLLALCTGHTQAATVYRCGDVYQQLPCAGGNAMRIDDYRTPEQQEQSLDQAEAQERQAKALRRQRLAEERAAAAAAAASPQSPSKGSSKAPAGARADGAERKAFSPLPGKINSTDSKPNSIKPSAN